MGFYFTEQLLEGATRLKLSNPLGPLLIAELIRVLWYYGT